MIETAVVQVRIASALVHGLHHDVDCCLVLHDGQLTDAIVDVGGYLLDIKNAVPVRQLYALWQLNKERKQ